MLQVKIFVFNHFEENTYLAVDQDTRQAAIIDPGMLHDNEKAQIDSFLKENDIKLTQIILTHAHLDHCFGADYVRNRYGIPIKAHAADSALLEAVHQQALRFGMKKAFQKGIDIDVKLNDGDIIEIGNSKLRVIHVPGHSPSGIILYDEADNLAFVGDSIFRGSIGRTDLEGGDFETLIKSLKNKALTLPDKTILLPGHGDYTSVEVEKHSNPFLT